MDLEALGTLEDARRPWEALEGEAGRVFSTWAWADAWWRVYGGGRRLAIHALRDGGRTVAILPLYRADRGPLPMLRLLGHGAGDELGPVCAPADAPLAAAALRELAATLPAGGLLLADRLRGDDPLLAHLPGSAVREESTPVVDAPANGGGFEGWLRTRSANFRSEIRRRGRRLREDHGVEIRLADDPDRLAGDLGALIELHRARWGDTASTAFAHHRARFHRDFAARALGRGWLRLWIAEAGGRPVGAIYSLRHGASEWYYQAGRDPGFERRSIGTVLLAHAICDAFGAGVRHYRLGVGDEPYKARFASADPGLRTLVVGRAPLRRAAVGAAGAVRRLPPALRRPLARSVA